MNSAPPPEHPPTDAWETFRAALVEKTLSAYYVLAWIGLPLFIWRSQVVGWRANHVFVVTLVVAGMAFYRFGKRLSTDTKSIVLVAVFFGLAVPGIVNLGLLSNGLLLIAAGCMAASLLLSSRVSAWLSVGSFVLLGIAGFAFVSGTLVIGTDANAFAASAAAWFTAVCVNFLSALILVHSVATFRRSLQSTLIEVQRQRDIIAHQANHDLLTGLPTLSLASDRLGMALNVARREATKVAVMFLALDGYKAANETFGHDVGDQVLRIVATRIRSSIRATDTACRIGGDEFLVILTEIPDAAIAAETARKIIAAIGRPISVGGPEVVVGCSIGIALFPDQGDDPRALRHAADLAMYAVKRSGKNAYRFSDAAPSADGD